MRLKIVLCVLVLLATASAQPAPALHLSQPIRYCSWVKAYAGADAERRDTPCFRLNEQNFCFSTVTSEQKSRQQRRGFVL